MTSVASSSHRARPKSPRNAGKPALPAANDGPHLDEVSELRRVYSLMAERAPVRLIDGRTGVITRVDTCFPDNQTTLHVWIEGGGSPGLAKVRADEVEDASAAVKTA